MAHSGVVWGGAAAAILGIGAAAIAIVVGVTATPEAHVERYLQALAADDLSTAARLAGLEPEAALPLGDSGEPSILRIVSRAEQSGGRVVVTTEYGSNQDAAITAFTLVAAPALLGIIPQWSFGEPPVQRVEVGADQLDRVVVNELEVVTLAAGGTVTVTAFVPARLEVRLDDPFVQGSAATVRLDGSAAQPIVLSAIPTSRLLRAVTGELEQYLADCAAQEVLLPTGCAFGHEIEDRAIGRPIWQVVADPVAELSPGQDPGRWQLESVAALRLTVTVQSLFDGIVYELDEVITTVIRGDVVVGPEGPQVTIYAPSP